MALKKIGKLLGPRGSQHEAVLAGTYTGGHPLHPQERKRCLLRLTLQSISLQKNPILGNPEEIFALALPGVLQATPVDHSFAHGDKLVERYVLNITFLDKFGDSHSFGFVSGDAGGVRDFLNKLNGNFYVLKEQALASPGEQEPQHEPTPPPTNSVRTPREL